MSLLAQAFMARDTLHQVLGSTTAVVCVDPHTIGEHIKVSTPLRPTPHGVTPILDITLEQTQDAITAQAFITPGPAQGRMFRFTRNNLLAFLGLESVRAFHRDDPGLLTTSDAVAWGVDTHQSILDFGWQQRRSVYMTAPLHPMSDLQADSLRNPKPFPRYKVFEERSPSTIQPWTYARLAPNGRDLSKHGPMFNSHKAAITAAEKEATSRGHIPVSDKPLHVSLWKSLWNKYYTNHTAFLSDGRFVEIYLAQDYGQDQDPDLWAITLRQHDSSEHEGSRFANTHESENEGSRFANTHEQAIVHALELIKIANDQNQDV